MQPLIQQTMFVIIEFTRKYLKFLEEASINATDRLLTFYSSVMAVAAKLHKIYILATLESCFCTNIEN